MTAYSGISAGGIPYSRIGDGEVPLFVFPGLDLSTHAAEGLHLQGLAQAFKTFAGEHSVYVVGRPPGPDYAPPDRDSEEDADDGTNAGEEPAEEVAGEFGRLQTAEEYAEELDRAYLEFVASQGSGPIRLLGIAYGGRSAVNVAAALADGRAPGRRVDRLALVSYAHHMSQKGSQRLLTAAELMIAGELRRFSQLMVTSMYPGLGGRLLYGPVAFLFPALAGTPSDPMTIAHLLKRQAQDDSSDLLPRLGCRTIFLGGGRDLYYPPETLEEAARLAGSEASGGTQGAVVRLFPNEGHGVFKSSRKEVHSVVSAFFIGEDGGSTGPPQMGDTYP